jgi:hypothetical protein
MHPLSYSMPSLFVWKAASPLPLTSSVTYYSGSNWFLEEHSTYFKSAMYLNQQTLSNHGYVYDIKWMPTNWVGSHLLENLSVPYALLKEDVAGRLEQLGDWMRFTSYHEVDDKEAEWERIQQWVVTNTVKKELVKSVVTKASQASQVSQASQEPCLINLSAGHSAVSHRNYSRPSQNHHQPHSRYPHQKKRIVA